MRSRIILITLAVLTTLLCCNSQKNKQADDFEIPDSIASDQSLSFQEETMGVIIENLASPVEVAAMLMDLDIPFSAGLLTDTKGVNDLNTNFEKSLILGYLSADLGYLNIYEKTTPIIDYISAIKTLTEHLRVGQFYDFSLLRRLSQQRHDLDSLMYISIRSFNQMNSFMESTRRGFISSLVISGLWIEGMYLATQLALEYPSEELYESIGEQKIIMEDLFTVLKQYKETPRFPELIEKLELLKKEFDAVEITYEAGEPEMVEDENGMLVIQQTETSIVNITEEQLTKIIERTSEIRNHFLNL